MSLILFPARPPKSTVYGRLLDCTVCGHQVDLIEIDLTAARADHWVDADTYVCGPCMVEGMLDG